jgi:colanic acid biosynthesis glycosyl transferase WcaI
LKILIISQYFWPENFRINDFVPELIARGHEVQILTGKPNYPSGKTFPEYIQNPHSYLSYEGAKIHRVPIVSRGNHPIRLFINYLSFVVMGSLIGPCKLRNFQPDLIFVYEPSPITVGLPAILLGKLKNAPIVFWALDLWPETLEAVGGVKSKTILWSIEKVVRFIYNNCSMVLGQSKSFIKSIQTHCDYPDRVHYFPSWAEELPNFAENAPISFAPEIKRNDDIFNILFAGNIANAQDMPSILSAANILRDEKKIRWIIVGDGRRFEWLQSEVKRLKLEKNFLLLGRFPLERMPSFFAHAGALLVSLKKDPVFSMTIPAKLQTYLMTGIPILGMLDGEGAKIIEESDAGICCGASDSIGLAAAIKKMSQLTKSQSDMLGQNGIKYSKKEFDRSMLINKLERFFITAAEQYSDRA